MRPLRFSTLVALFVVLALPGFAQIVQAAHTYEGYRCSASDYDYDEANDVVYVTGKCCHHWSNGEKACHDVEWVCTRDSPESQWYECEESETTWGTGPSNHTDPLDYTILGMQQYVDELVATAHDRVPPL